MSGLPTITAERPVGAWHVRGLGRCHAMTASIVALWSDEYWHVATPKKGRDYAAPMVGAPALMRDVRTLASAVIAGEVGRKAEAEAVRSAVVGALIAHGLRRRSAVRVAWEVMHAASAVVARHHKAVAVAAKAKASGLDGHHKAPSRAERRRIREAERKAEAVGRRRVDGAPKAAGLSLPRVTEREVWLPVGSFGGLSFEAVLDGRPIPEAEASAEAVAVVGAHVTRRNVVAYTGLDMTRRKAGTEPTLGDRTAHYERVYVASAYVATIADVAMPTSAEAEAVFVSCLSVAHARPSSAEAPSHGYAPRYANDVTPIRDATKAEAEAEARAASYDRMRTAFALLAKARRVTLPAFVDSWRLREAAYPLGRTISSVRRANASRVALSAFEAEPNAIASA